MVNALSFLSPTGLIPNCSECRIHSGFYIAWRNVEKTIAIPLAELLVMYPEYQLLITGHSMGGAVATLLVIPIQRERVNDRVFHINDMRRIPSLLHLERRK